MRVKIAVILAMVWACLVTPVLADPLDPPNHKIDVWLVERIGKAPRLFEGSMEVEVSEHQASMFIIGFDVKGRRRVLYDATYITYAGNYDPWTYAYVDGVGRTPDCPAQALCSLPGAEVMPYRRTFPFPDFNFPITMSFQVMTLNMKVNHITVSSGWRVRKLDTKGFAIHKVDGSGDGVHLGAVVMTTVEHFKGLTYKVDGPSVALVEFPAFPVCDGQAVLYGGDPPGFGNRRRMSCANPIAIGASSGPTTWKVVGESTGLTGSGQRFTVAVMPQNLP